MKILIIGGSGMVGSRVLTEATGRGHQATAVARTERAAGQAGSVQHPDRAGAHVETITPADAADPAAIAPLIAAHEVSVLAIRPAAGQEGILPDTTGVVLDVALAAGRPVLVIGGAGPLRSPGSPGVRLLDDARYVPLAWRAIATASMHQLKVCLGHRSIWSYLSPPAVLTPGRRTGRYRRGEENLLVDAQGISQISVEDLAVAVVDDLENGPTRGHWTVAY